MLAEANHQGHYEKPRNVPVHRANHQGNELALENHVCKFYHPQANYCDDEASHCPNKRAQHPQYLEWKEPLAKPLVLVFLTWIAPSPMHFFCLVCHKKEKEGKNKKAGCAPKQLNLNKLFRKSS
jgi:hypothetical protein